MNRWEAEGDRSLRRPRSKNILNMCTIGWTDVLHWLNKICSEWLCLTWYCTSNFYTSWSDVRYLCKGQNDMMIIIYKIQKISQNIDIYKKYRYISQNIMIFWYFVSKAIYIATLADTASMPCMPPPRRSCAKMITHACMISKSMCKCLVWKCVELISLILLGWYY